MVRVSVGVRAGSVGEVLAVFFKLGLTSFGGPVAHLGYFRTAFVSQRGWLSDTEYADLVALCQFLPGPASSQVGIAIGKMRAGLGGAIAAFVGFTLPSALLMLGFAWGALALDGPLAAGALHGLKLAALAVVVQAHPSPTMYLPLTLQLVPRIREAAVVLAQPAT